MTYVWRLTALVSIGLFGSAWVLQARDRPHQLIMLWAALGLMFISLGVKLYVEKRQSRSF